MNNEIFTTVQQLIADNFSIESHTIHPESRFYEDLGCGELDILGIHMTCEVEFDLDIESWEYGDGPPFSTVKELVERIETAQNERAQ